MTKLKSEWTFVNFAGGKRRKSPDFVVATVAEQTNGDDDVSFKGETLLSFKVLLLELCAAAEGYYFVFADHNN